MLLKSVTLNNFRQFQDAHIDFAQGIDGKNVTIIIGKNGSGKTSLAQAFFWCLYGETSFADKILLNRKVAENLSPNKSAAVRVELELRHGVFEYLLRRKQIYKKNAYDQIRSESTRFEIQQKDQTGNTKWLDATDLEYEVKRILPRELARYFFFDGERIEKMGQDVSAGKKAEEFAEAVKRLLGLSGMLSAIDHLGGGSGIKRNSVIGKYESDFDAAGDQKIRDFTATIERCDSELTKLEDQIKNLNEEIKSAENRKSEKEREIGQHESGRDLQTRKDQLKKEIEAAENRKSQKYKEICQCFNSPPTLNSFFSVWMIDRALKLLQAQNMLTNDIPLINAQVIETLLNQKKCLCGTDLEENQNAYETLKKLLESIPTQAISMEITKFKTEARMRTSNLTDVLGQILEKRKEISLSEDEILNKTEEIRRIDDQLGGEDAAQRIRTLHSEISECEKSLSKNRSELESLIRRQTELQSEKSKADTERQKLTNQDKNNRNIEICRAYARKIHQILQLEYKDKEEKTRIQLQDTINSIFKQIYASDLQLSIDSRYNVSVSVMDYSNGDIETSTAQSISVIFAFISGIIKIAKESHTDAEDSEPYPLVMDAPFSSFDKTRIGTICKVLPEITDQVIIFIKDTDGDLAEEYLREKIGNQYRFEVKDELETSIV